MRDAMKATLAAWALCAGLLAGGAASPAAADDALTPEQAPDAAAPAGIVARFAEWVVASGDNEGLPFVVIDKVEAEVFVFEPGGLLVGAAPALIGLAHGDESAPGIGERALSSIRPEERTTPAGRFVAGYGTGEGEQKVLWVDYDSAVSLHSLREVSLPDPRERRLQRLKSPSPQDNRITYGCINVPNAFYDNVVQPVFTGSKGVVYVLPEVRPLGEFFPDFERDLIAARKAAEKKARVAWWRKLF